MNDYKVGEIVRISWAPGIWKVARADRELFMLKGVDLAFDETGWMSLAHRDDLSPHATLGGSVPVTLESHLRPAVCECGATKCKSNLHSTWCPMRPNEGP